MRAEVLADGGRDVRARLGEVGAELDRRERVPDLVRHARDDAAERGPPLVLGELAYEAALVLLGAGEVAREGVQAFGDLGELAQLRARHLGVEVSTEGSDGLTQGARSAVERDERVHRREHHREHRDREAKDGHAERAHLRTDDDARAAHA